MSAETDIARLLRALAQAVERLGAAEVCRTLEARIHDLPGRKAARKVSAGAESDAGVLDRLSRSQTRDEVQAILAEIPNRERLDALARHLRIHVQKGDARPLVEQKITEAVVGRRLGREAIRTLDFGSGSTKPDSGSGTSESSGVPRT